jgi:hypothetical protein
MFFSVEFIAMGKMTLLKAGAKEVSIAHKQRDQVLDSSVSCLLLSVPKIESYLLEIKYPGNAMSCG